MRPKAVDFRKVFEDELKYIVAKRKQTGTTGRSVPGKDLFGIAMSGGGIRSATINLGFLEILNACGILARADYLSTVSGGGYTGGYIHTKLHETSNFKTLFQREDINHLRSYGEYLAPPEPVNGDAQNSQVTDGTLSPLQRVWRQANKLRLTGAFVASLIMNWVWVVLVSLFIVGLLALVAETISAPTLGFLHLMLLVATITLAIHYFLHFLRHFWVWNSTVLNYLEGFLLVLIFIPLGLHLCAGMTVYGHPAAVYFPLSVVALAFSGFFANPNILTMHRFYRDRLATAFLEAGARDGGKLKLCDLSTTSEPGKPSPAPYPLINACLNLVGADDLTFAGMRKSDYFLLSPNYVGSESTGYAQTTGRGYGRMTVGTAVAVSGAALNPEMGARTNKVLGFIMTLFNLQLGYWAYNPARIDRFTLPFTWWPYYHLLQLLSKTDSTRGRVNISDGGHVENLGAYELLRRKCKLIIVIDAGADPKYEFSDLNTLLIRARNELNLSISFKSGHEPEQRIKPSPSTGFSHSQFAIATISEMSGKEGKKSPYTGLFVYVKSSILAPEKWYRPARDDPEFWSFMYKVYHPSFPQESTADQFFDPDQWEAYYTLGKFLAGDLLGIKLRRPGSLQAIARKLETKNIDQLRLYLSRRGDSIP